MYQIMAQKIKIPTPYVTQSLSLSKTGISLGPVTLTEKHGIRPFVTFNVMLNSPYISQANARQ